MRLINRLHDACVLLLVCLLLLNPCTPGRASTFRSNGLGARARAMGGAFVAIADDTSAGFWNPAGLAFAEAPLTQLELKADRLDVAYIPPGDTLQRNNTHILVVPELGTIIPLHNQRFPTLELLGYVPYALQLQWDPQAAYRDNVTYDKIRVISAGGATAYQVNDRLAVGIAAFTNNGKVILKNAVPSLVYAGVAGLPDAAFSAVGSDTSPNVHLGVLWHANRALWLGLAYRSPIDLTIRGDADLAIPGGPVITDQWELPLTLPQSLSLGAAWQATPVLLVAGQADWVDWSSIDQQVINFQHGALPNSQTARNWRNRVQLRLGVEYTACKPIILRAGYSYDPTPVPDSTLDPLLLDLNRHIVSAGIGATGRNWAIDVSYEHFFGQSRTTTTSIHAFPTNGHYTGAVDVATLTISYRR